MRFSSSLSAETHKQQRYDGRDAWHIMELLAEGRFPRIWLPNAEEGGMVVLLNHRQFLVERRTRAKNGLQALALSCNLW